MISHDYGPSSDPLELAWAAGFYDGEGHTGAPNRSDKARQFQVAVPQVGEPPVLLQRFMAAVGVGRIGGPYFQPGRPKAYFKWYAYGEAAELALSRIWPYLTEVKRTQASQALLAYRRDETSSIPRGIVLK